MTDWILGQRLVFGLAIRHVPAGCVVLVQTIEVFRFLNPTRKKLDLSPGVADRKVFIWQMSWQVDRSD